jgi:hypothetical protein
MADVLGPIFETAGKAAEDGRKRRQGMDEIAAAKEITAEIARMHVTGNYAAFSSGAALTVR